MSSQGLLAVETHSIGKRFGTQWSVRNIELTIRRGESVALFGSNGSGKSTLLKILSTLLSPSQGTFSIMGWNGTRQISEIRKRIRLLSHEKQLYPLLTVNENLNLFSQLSRTSLSGMGPILERLEMTSFQDKKVATLSEGMKKRVMLAKLLIGSPSSSELIMLDEPQPTLDKKGRQVLSELIQEWRSQGKTLIMTSHDHAETLAHADRLITLEAGKIIFDGKPDMV